MVSSELQAWIFFGLSVMVDLICIFGGEWSLMVIFWQTNGMITLVLKHNISWDMKMCLGLGVEF